MVLPPPGRLMRPTKRDLLHPSSCSWTYERPGYEAVLQPIAEGVCAGLRAQTIEGQETAVDTRPIHKALFTDLTPPDARYYAGNYRGSEHRCLKRYRVSVRTGPHSVDPYVGYEPGSVAFNMGLLTIELAEAFNRLDRLHARTDVSAVEKTKFTVTVAAAMFEFFLRIHPYADGNGHAARFLLWAFLGSFGYWPERCTVEPKPATRSEYCASLATLRSQRDPLPLERWILACLEPTAIVSGVPTRVGPATTSTSTEMNAPLPAPGPSSSPAVSGASGTSSAPIPPKP